MGFHLIDDIDTAGYLRMGAQQGWQCPVCKRVLAPFVTECPCKGSVPSPTVTWTAPDSITGGTMPFVECNHIPTIETID